jgi:hypothetical protein
MSGFDIENLLEFRPARNWCLNCLALWENIFEYILFDKRNEFIKCKVCGVKYIGTEYYTLDRVNDFIDHCIGLPLKDINNIVEHGTQLASISRMMRRRMEDYPPLRSLLKALAEARSFVHFISWGITQLMIGSLKVAAQRVPVRGIVSGNVGEQIMCEVNDFKHEAPDLKIIFCEPTRFRTIDIPHQKLIVIDGLLAFKGSANLTQMSWRSAEKDMEIIEVVSNTNEIISLHNQFFSPVWGKMNNDYGEIVMDASFPCTFFKV